MGFFDKLVKTVKETATEETFNNMKNQVKETFSSENINKVKDQVEGALGVDLDGSTQKNSQGQSIPSEYSHFPAYGGKLFAVRTKNESKYKRCTMNYGGASPEDIDAYRQVVENAGYKKMTDVRYEKDNEYIIIDDNSGECALQVVFHVRY